MSLFLSKVYKRSPDVRERWASPAAWGEVVRQIINFLLHQGTSAEQDNRFSNKQKKLLKQLKFAECLDKKVMQPVDVLLSNRCLFCVVAVYQLNCAGVCVVPGQSGSAHHVGTASSWYFWNNVVLNQLCPGAFCPTGGHDQSQPGSHQALDYSASHRDSGVRGWCRHRVYI